MPDRVAGAASGINNEIQMIAKYTLYLADCSWSKKKLTERLSMLTDTNPKIRGWN